MSALPVSPTAVEVERRGRQYVVIERYDGDLFDMEIGRYLFRWTARRAARRRHRELTRGPDVPQVVLSLPLHDRESAQWEADKQGGDDRAWLGPLPGRRDGGA